MSVSAQTKSKRVLGAGVIIAGLIVIGTGLIFGIRFPKYVHRMRLPYICVNSKESLGFPSWAGNASRTVENNLYFWTIENKDEFLLQGKHPKMRERGPYIFEETELKTDITFLPGGFLRYKSSFGQKFNIEKTMQKNKNFSANDEISIVNPLYLKKISQRGSLTKYMISLIPKVYRSIRMNRNCSEESIRSFSCWLILNNTECKTAVLNMDVAFEMERADEVLNLRNILSTEKLLGSKHKILPSSIIWKNCRNLRDKKCSGYIRDNKQALLELGLWRLTQSNDVPKIMALRLWPYFCSNMSLSCKWFKVMSATDDEKKELIKAFTEYVFGYLTEIIAEAFETYGSMDLVRKVSVENLSLGWKEHGYFSTDYYPGILPQSRYVHLSDEEDKTEMLQVNLMYTCLNNNSTSANLYWKTIANPWTHSELDVSGYSRRMPPADNVNACFQSEPLSTIKVLIPQIFSDGLFEKKLPTQISGTDVYLYTLDRLPHVVNLTEKMLLRNKDIPLMEKFGYPIRAKPNDCFHCQFSGMETGLGNKIYFESFTGEEWYRETTFNFSLELKGEYLTSLLKRSNLNISEALLNTTMPFVTWGRTEYIGEELKDSFQKNLKSKIILKVSCICYITLIFVGSIILLFGFKIFIKGGIRIFPSHFEENSYTSDNFKSRHLVWPKNQPLSM